MKTKLQALKKERAALVTEGQGIFAAAAADDDRDLNVEEREKFDAGILRIDVIDGDIARMEGQAEREKTLTAVDAVDVEPEAAKVPAQPKASPTPFGSFGEQLIAVAMVETGRQSQHTGLLEIAAASGMSEGIAADGGFLVQQDFIQELLRKTRETGVLVGRTRTIPVGANSNGIKIPFVNETSRANGSRWGAIRAYWTGEGSDKTASEMKLGRLDLELQKLTGLAYATDELLADAFALEAVMMQGFTEEFGFKLDDAIVRGTGGGQPLGILPAPALISVAKEMGQAATTIVQANISKMWSRMYARSRANAIWVINQDCEPQLDALSVVVGTGGTAVYMPAGGLNDSPYGRLKGRPVIPIEQCPTLGTVGDIMLLDLSQYLMIDKGGMQAATSIHVKFVEDETAFRFVLRIDGQPIWNSALTPYQGTNTVSPYVALATRA